MPKRGSRPRRPPEKPDPDRPLPPPQAGAEKPVSPPTTSSHKTDICMSASATKTCAGASLSARHRARPTRSSSVKTRHAEFLLSRNIVAVKSYNLHAMRPIEPQRYGVSKSGNNLHPYTQHRGDDRRPALPRSTLPCKASSMAFAPPGKNGAVFDSFQRARIRAGPIGNKGLRR